MNLSTNDPDGMWTDAFNLLDDLATGIDALTRLGLQPRSELLSLSQDELESMRRMALAFLEKQGKAVEQVAADTAQLKAAIRTLLAIIQKIDRTALKVAKLKNGP